MGEALTVSVTVVVLYFPLLFKSDVITYFCPSFSSSQRQSKILDVMILLFGSTPSEEFELTANSQGAHMKVTESSSGMTTHKMSSQ